MSKIERRLKKSDLLETINEAFPIGAYQTVGTKPKVKKGKTKPKSNKKQELEELVDEKGGKLQGDKHIDQVGKAASSKDTTDDAVHKKAGIQASRYNPKISWMDDNEEFSLKEIGKKKMKGVVEDILSKRKFDKDVMDKVKYSNGIPEVDEVKESLPVLVRKISHIKTLLDREEVSGEEKAILLNSLLSVNLTDIPAQYKRELARKLGY
jgi:hypothetical protein